MAWEGSTRSKRLPWNWESSIRPTVLRRDPVCRVCGLNASAQVDHIVRGDDHSLDNLRGICIPCHGRKSGREGNAARRNPYRRPPEKRDEDGHPGFV